MPEIGRFVEEIYAGVVFAEEFEAEHESESLVVTTGEYMPVFS